MSVFQCLTPELLKFLELESLRPLCELLAFTSQEFMLSNYDDVVESTKGNSKIFLKCRAGEIKKLLSHSIGPEIIRCRDLAPLSMSGGLRNIETVISELLPKKSITCRVLDLSHGYLEHQDLYDIGFRLLPLFDKVEVLDLSFNRWSASSSLTKEGMESYLINEFSQLQKAIQGKVKYVLLFGHALSGKLDSFTDSPFIYYSKANLNSLPLRAPASLVKHHIRFWNEYPELAENY